ATVTAVAVTSDSKRVATGSDDKSARVWDAENGKSLRDFGKLDGHVNCIAFSPDGKLLAAGSSDGKITISNADAENVNAAAVGAIQPALGTLYQVAFTPDGKGIATCGERAAKVFSVPSGPTAGALILYEFGGTNGHQGLVGCLAISPNGKWIATGSADKSIRIWEMSSANKLLRVLQGHDEQVSALAITPDGETLISASMDQSVRMWSLTPTDPHRSFDGHTSYVWSAVFSPNGKQIASGGADRTVRLWDVAGGKMQHKLEGHKLPITCVAYSPDGET